MITRLLPNFVLGAMVAAVPFLAASCAHGYVGIGVHDDRYYHDRPVVVHEDRPVIVHEDHHDYRSANERW